MNKKTFYAGYGSNFNPEVMLGRRPDSKFVSGGVLENWALTLPHFADIEMIPGENTPVAVWEIDEAGLASLDKQEGVDRTDGGGYVRTPVKVNVNGKTLTAMAYTMRPMYKENEKALAASKTRIYEGGGNYVETIKTGYEFGGFSKDDMQPLKYVLLYNRMDDGFKFEVWDVNKEESIHTIETCKQLEHANSELAKFGIKIDTENFEKSLLDVFTQQIYTNRSELSKQLQSNNAIVQQEKAN